jgi:hypothetical protein
MAKLYDQATEIRVLYALLDLKLPRRIRNYLWDHLEADSFHFPPTKAAFYRVQRLKHLKKSIPSWQGLTADLAIDSDYRTLLKERKPDHRITSRREAKECIAILKNHLLARDLYESSRETIEGLTKTEVRASELAALRKAKLRKTSQIKRPICVLRPGEFAEAMGYAHNRLPRMSPRTYQRAGELVSIISVPGVTAEDIYHQKRSLIIHRLDTKELRSVFDADTEWRKEGVNPVTKKKITKKVDCPARIAETVDVERGNWLVKPLQNIVNCPTLRPDFSIIQEKGYDVQTGIYYDPGDVEYPKIPEKPTRNQARAAWKVLRKLLKDFPFEEEWHRSVAIAAILTSLVRHLLDKAPAFGIKSPVASSGKSTLADAISFIATGAEAEAITWTGDEHEDRKVLSSALLEGASVICLDNVEEHLPIGGAAFCSLLTQLSYKFREMKKHKLLQVPTAVTVIANGISLTFKNDATTRVLMCTLDPKREDPEDKEFKRDISEYLIKHRAELVVAALTILRAYYVYHQEKMQDKLWKFTYYNRFRKWNQLVRAPIVWLGKPDPAKSRDEVVANDPVKAQIGEIYQVWYARLQEGWFKVSEVIQEASRPGADELLRVLLENFEDRGGKVNARRLANWLAKRVNRRVGGLVLQHRRFGHSFQWSIKCYDSSLLPPLPDAEAITIKRRDSEPNNPAEELEGKTRI